MAAEKKEFSELAEKTKNARKLEGKEFLSFMKQAFVGNFETPPYEVINTHEVGNKKVHNYTV
jgi:hypothetical protein